VHSNLPTRPYLTPILTLPPTTKQHTMVNIPQNIVTFVLRIQVNSSETCCCTVCTTSGCNCHTAAHQRAYRCGRHRRTLCREKVWGGGFWNPCTRSNLATYTSRAAVECDHRASRARADGVEGGGVERLNDVGDQFRSGQQRPGVDGSGSIRTGQRRR